VLKLHADPAGFAGETLAYELLTGTAPVAQMHAENEASLSLLLEYLPQPVDWGDAGMPAVLADRVAAVHTASLRLPEYAVGALAGFSLGRMTPAHTPAWIADELAWADVVAAHVEAYGRDLVPLGHLDLKPDHLRQRADGNVVLLDVETVRPDVTGLIDLVTLPAVLRQAGHNLSLGRVTEGSAARVRRSDRAEKPALPEPLNENTIAPAESWSAGAPISPCATCPRCRRSSRRGPGPGRYGAPAR
jgi:hypothetical protein